MAHGLNNSWYQLEAGFERRLSDFKPAIIFLIIQTPCPADAGWAQESGLCALRRLMTAEQDPGSGVATPSSGSSYRVPSPKGLSKKSSWRVPSLQHGSPNPPGPDPCQPASLTSVQPVQAPVTLLDNHVLKMSHSHLHSLSSSCPQRRDSRGMSFPCPD